MKILRLVPLALLAVAMFATSTQRARAEKEPPPACLKSWGETRARAVGYDHIVIIDNACPKPAACVVTTDVAPEPLRVTVTAGARIELTTFRGSPATAFTPRTDCKLQ